jgi:hypothetical protein
MHGGSGTAFPYFYFYLNLIEGEAYWKGKGIIGSRKIVGKIMLIGFGANMAVLTEVRKTRKGGHLISLPLNHYAEYISFR